MHMRTHVPTQNFVELRSLEPTNLPSSRLQSATKFCVNIAIAYARSLRDFSHYKYLYTYKEKSHKFGDSSIVGAGNRIRVTQSTGKSTIHKTIDAWLGGRALKDRFECMI